MNGHTVRRRPVMPAGLAAPVVAAIATVSGLALLVATNGVGSTVDWGLAGNVSSAVLLIGAGTLLTHRRAGRKIGLLLLSCGTAMALNLLAGGYATAATRHGWAGAAAAGWATTWLWAWTVIPLTTVLPAVFPDGRALSPRWRPALLLGWASTAATAVVSAMNVGSAAERLTGTLWAIAGSAALLGLVCRWRRADGTGRQQLKFLMLAFGVVIVIELVHPWLPYHVAQASFFSIPLILLAAIALAVLKYRLYDIDVLINRSVIYGTLTGAIVGIYLMVTWLGGAALSGATTLPAVVAAVVVAIGVAPARHRLQRALDRLLYGERNDPLRAVSRLGDSVSETGEPHLLAAVLASVMRAVRASGAAVLAPDGRELASVGTEVHAGRFLPLRVGGSQVGVLRVAARGPRETYNDADHRLLAALAPSVAVVVRALALAEAVEAERDRVVAATAVERDRLRRDLHDGLGPSLSGIGLGLEALDGATRASDDGAGLPLLDRLRTEVSTAVGEVRRILDELNSAALQEVGLVENTTFRTSTEALASIARHAHARNAEVSIVTDDQARRLTGDANADGPGAGLTSMRHRAESLGERLRIDTGHAGTTVTATLPLEQS